MILKEKRIRNCFHPDKSKCSGKIVNSHSIQNNKFLNILAEDGKVYMAKHTFTNGELEIETQLVGRKSATTFTGFCQFHDNMFFKTIEEKNYNNEVEQNVLYAFRALVREYHAKKEAVKMMNKYSVSNEYIKYAQYGYILGVKDGERYLKKFESIFKNKLFSLLETKTIVFEENCLIAVSATISPTNDFYGNDLDNLKTFGNPAKLLFITIFPQDGKTYILLTYLKKEKKFFSFLDKQLLKKSSKQKKINLSNLIVTNCENFVISPRLWKVFSQDQKERFINTFKSTVFSNGGHTNLTQDWGFNLFL